MNWYEGSIAEAITFSRKKSAIFVVYIEGSDEESRKLTGVINEGGVSKVLGSEHFVAIKIEANSVPHQQFSEIYRGAKVPTVYFIGKNGAPLDIIEKVDNSKEFLDKILDVLKKAGISINQSVAQSSDLIEKEKQNSETPLQGLATGTSKGVEQVETPLQDLATGTSNGADNVETSQEPLLTTDEKVEKVKDIIEKNRETKRKEEEEKERLKEIERRKLGQDVQKMQRLQHDQELKLLFEAREKDKREQLEAKQRILEQIKQDKADRAAKFGTNQQSPQPPPQVSVPPVQQRSALAEGMTRIQFKLPDGSTYNKEFRVTDTLQDVKLHIKAQLNLSFNFILATTFPRREFTNEHDGVTLADLELLPSAVLLILPVSHGTVTTNNRSFTSFLWSILAPILNALSYMKSFIFGAPKPSAAQQPTTSTDNNKRPADGESSRQQYKKRAGETTVIRRQGNVHRLSDKTDSDDDNNTWNGNSTQQM